jgi:hypothetical protein
VIAETHGRGLVAPVVPTLAPLRTLIRLALALRPVLLGAMLARAMLARPLLTRLAFTRPVLARCLLPRRLLTRCMLPRLMLLGAGFGLRLGRGPGRALVMLARLPGLAARAARPLAGAAATTPTASAAATVGGLEVRDIQARHLDAGNGEKELAHELIAQLMSEWEDIRQLSPTDRVLDVYDHVREQIERLQEVVRRPN